jgi:hypothetical protein
VAAGAKGQFYSTVYYITLNPICVAQRASTNLMKIMEVRLESQNEQIGDLSVKSCLFKEKIMVKSHFKKSNNSSEGKIK